MVAIWAPALGFAGTEALAVLGGEFFGSGDEGCFHPLLDRIAQGPDLCEGGGQGRAIETLRFHHPADFPPRLAQGIHLLAHVAAGGAHGLAHDIFAFRRQLAEQAFDRQGTAHGKGRRRGAMGQDQAGHHQIGGQRQGQGRDQAVKPAPINCHNSLLPTGPGIHRSGHRR